MLSVLPVGSSPAQEAPTDLEARARALAEERLGPLLEALRGPREESPPEGVRFAVRFAGSVQGLAAGAPVTIRGLRVGTVREISVTFDSATGALDVPVVIDVVPGSLVVDGARPETEAGVRNAMATLVGRGLRAQLASASLLSTEREIALDLVPDAAPAAMGAGAVPVIPSVPTRLDALAAVADKLLARLDEVPVERLTAELETVLMGLHELVTGPELREALANLTAMSAELRDLPGRFEARSAPLLSSAVAATDQAGQAVADARRTIAALDASFGSRSTLQSDLQTLLREVTGATRALRQVLDLLQRQPDVLIRGKQGGPPP